MLLSGVLKEFILWAEARSVAKWGVVLRSGVLSSVVLRGTEGVYTMGC